MILFSAFAATLDAEFEKGHLPEIYNALKIDTEIDGRKLKLTSEVQMHLGGNRVRAVALSSTDGIVRPLAGLELAAGKLPEAGQRLAFGALRDQDALVGVNQRARHHQCQFEIGHP